MDFFNEFGKKFSSVARSVSEKSKESAEVTRLNARLREAQEALEKLYCRYGKVCYALQLGGGSREEAEQLALRIRAAQLELEECTDQREAAREAKRCPGCGAVCPKEARFCSACGKRLPEEAPRPEPVEPGEYCPGCGAKRENSEAFCPVCGASFDGIEAVEPVPEAHSEPVDSIPDVEEPVENDVEGWNE